MKVSVASECRSPFSSIFMEENLDKYCIGCPLQGFGIRGSTLLVGMDPLRRGQGLPCARHRPTTGHS